MHSQYKNNLLTQSNFANAKEGGRKDGETNEQGSEEGSSSDGGIKARHKRDGEASVYARGKFEEDIRGQQSDNGVADREVRGSDRGRDRQARVNASELLYEGHISCKEGGEKGHEAGDILSHRGDNR